MELQASPLVNIDKPDFAPKAFNERCQLINSMEPEVSNLNIRDAQCVWESEETMTVDSMIPMFSEWGGPLNALRVSPSLCIAQTTSIKMLDPSSVATWGVETNFPNMLLLHFIKGKATEFEIEKFSTSSIPCPNLAMHAEMNSTEQRLLVGTGAFNGNVDIYKDALPQQDFYIYVYNEMSFVLDSVPIPPGALVRNRCATVEKPGYKAVKMIKFVKATQGGEKTLPQIENIQRSRFMDQNKYRRLIRENMGDEERHTRVFSVGLKGNQLDGGLGFFSAIKGAMNDSTGNNFDSWLDKNVKRATHTKVATEYEELRDFSSMGGVWAPKEEHNGFTMMTPIQDYVTMNPHSTEAGYSYGSRNQTIKVVVSPFNDVFKIFPSRVAVQCNTEVRIVNEDFNHLLQRYTLTYPAIFPESKINGGGVRKLVILCQVLKLSHAMGSLFIQSMTVDCKYDVILEEKEIPGNVRNMHITCTGQGLICPEVLICARQRSEPDSSYAACGSWMDMGEVSVVPKIKREAFTVSAGQSYPFVDKEKLYNALKTGKYVDGNLFPSNFEGAKASDIVTLKMMVNVIEPKTYVLKEEVVGYTWMARPLGETFQIKMNAISYQAQTSVHSMGLPVFNSPLARNELCKNTIAVYFDHDGMAPRKEYNPSGIFLPKVSTLSVIIEKNTALEASEAIIDVCILFQSKNYMVTSPAVQSEIFA